MRRIVVEFEENEFIEFEKKVKDRTYREAILASLEIECTPRPMGRPKKGGKADE